MPELPEVEIIVRDIKEIEGCKVIFNKVFEKIDSIRKTPIYNLSGRIIEKVERYGKYILIKFDSSAFLIHLAMSGKLFLDGGDVLIPKHCHWLIQLDDGRQLRFVDHRHFGNLWNMSYKECRNYVEARLGPEPFDLSPESFILRIRQNKYLDKDIKTVLLDQHLIAGVGNIYASEACWEAYLNPNRLVRSLNDKELEHYLYAIRKVLKKGIKNMGTTIGDYRNAKNQTGNNQNFLGAYKQTVCRRCTNSITKKKTGDKDPTKGRATYWCPNCQNEGEDDIEMARRLIPQ